MRLALTIITVCFKNPDELHTTLKSLDGLRPELCEVVVIDGSPDDSCVGVVREFAWVRYFHGPDNGQYDGMNKGIILANGDTLLFINSGDLLHNHSLLEQALIEHRDRLGDMLLFGDSIRILAGQSILVHAPDITPETQRLAKFPSHQSILIPRNYHRNNLFDDKMYVAADSKMLRKAFEELPRCRLNFAVGEFKYGGACTAPGTWKSVWRNYGELREVCHFTAWEKLMTAFMLVRRKIFFGAFGAEALQRAQLNRIRRRHLLPREAFAEAVR